MALLLLELVSAAGEPLETLLDDLLADVGPAHYARTDLRLSKPVAKSEMVAMLSSDAPGMIGAQRVAEVQTTDGVKYLMDDDSWLLIRPSGTEPVLRVYAEARDEAALSELLGYGEKVASQA
jgi:phosphomannomutase